MTGKRLFLRLSAVAFLLTMLVAGVVGQAPSGATSTPGPPRRADGKPDLSGVWMPPYVPDMTVNKRDQRGYAEAPFSPDDTPQVRQAFYAKGNKAELPFTPAGLADWARYDAATGDYTGSCFPFGLQRSVNAPYPFQIMQDEKQVAFLFEINTWHHVVPFAREFPAIMADNPTWYGYSIAHWTGDTLVARCGAGPLAAAGRFCAARAAVLPGRDEAVADLSRVRRARGAADLHRGAWVGGLLHRRSAEGIRRYAGG